ncbi:MAG: 4Fe-4S binding protein [Bacteroidales bacterium]
MRIKHLKSLRVIVSLFFLVVAALIFIDFRHEFSEGFISSFLFLQFAPSVLKILQVLGLSAIGFIIILILTILFGRVYCSTICPLGIFQDVVSWLSVKLRKKKWPYKFARPHNILRYSLLGLTVGFLIFGSVLILNLLDPYSNFGRFFSYFAQPVVLKINNWLAPILTSQGIYTLFPVSVPAIRWEVMVFPTAMLILVLWLSYKYGRLYCNTVCPVGTLLGLVSRYSLFRIYIDENSCTNCGRCDRICKSSCISFREGDVDFSRCVACYNCLSICPDNAIKYSAGHKKREPVFTGVTPQGRVKSTDKSKRNFLLSSLIMLFGINRFSKASVEDIPQPEQDTTIPEDKNYPVSPPGSVSLDHFNKACTACTLCVSVCPTHVLQPSLLEYGVGGLLQPHMDFNAGFCNFDCVKCGEVCPTGAILPLTLDNKHVTQIGVVKFERENCVVYTDNTSCGACSEHCPTRACDMVPYMGELTIPEVNEDICIGCGACEYICPTRPYRAIYVDGNHRHEFADRPDTEKVEKEVDFEDFPF